MARCTTRAETRLACYHNTRCDVDSLRRVCASWVDVHMPCCNTVNGVVREGRRSIFYFMDDVADRWSWSRRPRAVVFSCSCHKTQTHHTHRTLSPPLTLTYYSSHLHTRGLLRCLVQTASVVVGVRYLDWGGPCGRVWLDCPPGPPNHFSLHNSSLRCLLSQYSLSVLSPRTCTTNTRV